MVLTNNIVYTGNFKKLSPALKSKAVGIVRFINKSFPTDIENDYNLAIDEESLLSYKSFQMSQTQYEDIYRRRLEQIGAKFIFETYKGKILCCYCDDGKFCHRHILSKFLNEHGYKSREMGE